MCFLYLFLMSIVYLCQHCLNETFSAFILYGLLSVFYTIERWGISYFQLSGVTSWSAVYFRNRLYFLVYWPNIELKTSKSINLLIEVIEKARFWRKKANSLRIHWAWIMCVADIADCDSVNCTKRFLLFSYLDLRVCFARYPPESFKIICLTCIWSKLVNTSFRSSQNSRRNAPLNGHKFCLFKKIISWNSKRPRGWN